MVRIGTLYISRYHQVITVLRINGKADRQGLCSGYYVIIRCNEKFIIRLANDHTGTCALGFLLIGLSVEVALYLLNAFICNGHHGRHGICHDLLYTVGRSICCAGGCHGGSLCSFGLALAFRLRCLGYCTIMSAYIAACSERAAYQSNCKCNGSCTFHHFSKILVMLRALSKIAAFTVDIIIMVYRTVLLKVLILVVSEFF